MDKVSKLTIFLINFGLFDIDYIKDKSQDIKKMISKLGWLSKKALQKVCEQYTTVQLYTQNIQVSQMQHTMLTMLDNDSNCLDLTPKKIYLSDDSQLEVSHTYSPGMELEGQSIKEEKK